MDRFQTHGHCFVRDCWLAVMVDASRGVDSAPVLAPWRARGRCGCTVDYWLFQAGHWTAPCHPTPTSAPLLLCPSGHSPVTALTKHNDNN